MPAGPETPSRRSRGADLAALAALALLCAGVYGPHLAGHATMIGNSDRLNTFMNVRKFQAETIRRGGLQGWNERMLGGFSTWGAPYMFAYPLAPLEAHFPERHLYRGFALVSLGWLILAAAFAYAFIKDVVEGPFAAFVGAALYALSAFSIFRNVQVDDAYYVVVFIPLVLLVLRRLRDGNAAACYAGLTLMLAFLYWTSFVQEIAYAMILFGCYAVWRGVQRRRWRVPIVFAASVVTALLLAAPRIGTVAQDLTLLDRTSTFFAYNPLEFLRWFHDGIFGNTYLESNAINPGFNLWEGVRIYTSGFAAMLVVASLVRAPNGTWFPLVPSKREDAAFFVLMTAGVLVILLAEPFTRKLYELFLKRDLLHGRFSVAALLPVCALAASLLQDMLDRIGDGASRAASIVLGAAGGAAIVAAIPAAARGVATLLGLPPALRWGELQQGYMGLAPLPLAQVLVELAVFAGVLALGRAFAPSDLRRRTAAVLLGSLMAFSAFATSYARINGPQTKTRIPFEHHELMSAAPEDFRIPEAASVEALHRRLESRDFRSVVIADAREFPEFSAPHLSQFWELRLLDGYANGLPKRMIALPWPPGVRTLRAITFTEDAALAWPLLSAFNVKYAIRLDRELYFNRGPGGGDARPGTVEVVESPMPVAPREFWAASVAPAKDYDEAAAWFKASALPGVPSENLARASIAEGFGAPKTFAVGGPIRAEYEGDRVRVRFERSDKPRFLVLNETYHPSWKAYSPAGEARVYATNVMMRGVEVPPGVTEVEFRFYPFLKTQAASWIFVAGDAILILVCAGLVGFERRRRALA